MTKDELIKELGKLAIRFSEGWHEGIKIDASDIMLLNEAAQALAQPEQEPYGIALTNIPHPQGVSAPDDLNADALEVVELELPDECEAVGWADDGVINWIAGKQFKHASFLYPTHPQRTEQEPVAWEQLHEHIAGPFYTHPTQRTWVGLEGEEIRNLWEEATKPDRSTMTMVTSFARAIEAKLKQKNGYAEEKNT